MRDSPISQQKSMSASAIEYKLRTFWNEKSTVSEAEVVYVLVEIVKHFERDKVEKVVRRPNISTNFIRFFRNWAVHGVIDRSKIAQEVLKMYTTFGKENFYEEMVKKLIEEINKCGIMPFPANLETAFKTSLYHVIEDVPIDIVASTIRLTARGDGFIYKDKIP